MKGVRAYIWTDHVFGLQAWVYKGLESTISANGTQPKQRQMTMPYTLFSLMKLLIIHVHVYSLNFQS